MSRGPPEVLGLISNPAPQVQRLAASLPRVSGPLQEGAPQHGRWGASAHGRPQPSSKRTSASADSKTSTVTRTGKNLPHSVGLPDAVLLGRNELCVEVIGISLRESPPGAILPHHSDRPLVRRRSSQAGGWCSRSPKTRDQATRGLRRRVCFWLILGRRKRPEHLCQTARSAGISSIRCS